MSPAEHRVVVVGGGFGGLYAARALAKTARIRVTLVDRRNYHLFQPLLYQVATGGLSPGDISAPLRSVLKRRPNAEVLQAEVTGFDAADRRVLLADRTLDYDSLVVAAGATHHWFGNDAWAAHAPGLKTIEDATRIRSHVLSMFERAEWAGAHERDALLTFVLVGGGPTGVELAGAIGELARHTLRREFRHASPERARVVLVEAVDRVLPGYPATLSRAAARSLEKLGVEVRTSCRVTDVRADGVRLATSGRGEETLGTRTVLWAAGVQGSPLGRELARATGVALDRAGRVVVEPDLSIAHHPEISVVGDLATFLHQGDEPLAGVAPVAMQQGRYVAHRIADRIAGRHTPPFRYRERGRLAVIGRASAVADLGRLRFTGYAAWLLWLFVHIMYLVGFENRLLVFVQWAFDYFTRKRGARLITEY
jgi:NADH dehydrogenase